jgi:hypothetical protein
VAGGSTTEYVIDPYNHTGFAQVFKEIGDSNTVYIYGHDVIGQATATDAPKYMLYDGHGSVRQLSNNVGSIVAKYAYDAYGNAHTFDPVGSCNIGFRPRSRRYDLQLLSTRGARRLFL